MTHYLEYTLFLPPNCPTMWDHLTQLYDLTRQGRESPDPK